MPTAVRQLDHKAVAQLLRDVWPDVQLRELSIEKVHTGRNSDHFRVHHRERSMILRSAPQGEGAVRYVAALEALTDAEFTPDLLGQVQSGGKCHLVLMEDVGVRTFTGVDVEEQLGDLLDIVRGVHESDAFAAVVADVGLDELESEEPPEWFETSLQRVREVASDDERLGNIERWLAVAQKQDGRVDLINSVLVHGHGDLQRDNWMRTSRGPVLIDWEDIGLGSLANELASLVVFGHLDPRTVAERYGVDAEYVEAVEIASARTALFLYGYWLHALLDEEATHISAEDGDFAYAEALCERVFG